MSNELKIKKGLTWAEWSIIVAFGVIVVAIVAIGWAGAAVQSAWSEISNANAELATVKAELDEAREKLASAPSDGNLVEQLKYTVAALTQERNEAANRVGQLQGHLNTLNGYIDEHVRTRWFTLEGRPSRNP